MKNFGDFSEGNINQHFCITENLIFTELIAANQFVAYDSVIGFSVLSNLTGAQNVSSLGFNSGYICLKDYD